MTSEQTKQLEDDLWSVRLLVQEWVKDIQTRFAVNDEVGAFLNNSPKETYDKALLIKNWEKGCGLTLDLFINQQRWPGRDSHKVSVEVIKEVGMS